MGHYELQGDRKVWVEDGPSNIPTSHSYSDSLSIPRKLLYTALIPILFVVGILIGILIVGEMGTTSKILSFFTVIVVLFGLLIYAIYSIIHIWRSKEKSGTLLFMVLSNGIFPFAWVIVNHFLAKFGII